MFKLQAGFPRRIFSFKEVRMFAWDACKEVVEKKTYNEPWAFQDFLTASKRYALNHTIELRSIHSLIIIIIFTHLS